MRYYTLFWYIWHACVCFDWSNVRGFTPTSRDHISNLCRCSSTRTNFLVLSVLMLFLILCPVAASNMLDSSPFSELILTQTRGDQVRDLRTIELCQHEEFIDIEWAWMIHRMVTCWTLHFAPCGSLSSACSAGAAESSFQMLRLDSPNCVTRWCGDVLGLKKNHSHGDTVGPWPNSFYIFLLPSVDLPKPLFGKKKSHVKHRPIIQHSKKLQKTFQEFTPSHCSAISTNF